MDDSAHFAEMLTERGIDQAWADKTIERPEKVEERDDGTRHYLRRIPEYGDRWLRVVVNVAVEPNLRVTAFFDRRLREQK